MSDNVHIVIPARRDDPLFPDKILAPLNGKPLIWHVWQQAVAARLGEVTIACDDSAVFERLTALGMVCVMTERNLSPFMRTAQALDKLGIMAEVVVIVSPDIPQLSSAVLRSLVPPLWRADVDVSLAMWPEADHVHLQDPTQIKVAATEAHRAVYFSRCMVPYGATVGRCLANIAALRRDTLNRLVEHKAGALELEENIFWLRTFDLGLHSHVTLLDTPLRSIQTPDDLQSFSA